jgi:hypothetical protein
MTLIALSCLALALSDDAVKPKPAKTCLTRRQIHAISPLESHHALARLSAGRLYLLTLDESCRELTPAFTRNLVLVQPEARVCDDGTSMVSFEESGAGSTRCRIVKIDRVDSKEAARELIDSRKEERER